MDEYTRDIVPTNIIINFKQDHGNISDGDMRTIISQRTDIMKHTKFSEMNYEFKEYLQKQHTELDESIRKNSKRFSSQKIQKSSQTSQVILTDNMIDKLKSINPNAEGFFRVALNDTEGSDKTSYRDPSYNNCLMIPLKKVLFKFDRKRIILQANSKYDIQSTDKKTKKLPALILVTVLEIHKKENEHIRDEIYKFVTGIFSNKEDKVLTSVLVQEDTRVLILISDKVANEKGKKICQECMIAVIIFGGHQKEGFVIDYLAIESSCRNHSFGPLLINLSQMFSCQIIKKKNFGKQFKRVHTAYLACIKDEIGSFYESIGFHHVKDTAPFLEQNELSLIGKRLKIDTWESTEDKKYHLSCYSIDALCYRWVNRITPGSNLIEDAAYNTRNLVIDDTVKIPQDLINIFKSDIEVYNLNILNSAVLQEYMDDLKDVTTIDEVYNKLLPSMYNLPIGKLFSYPITKYIDDLQSKNPPETYAISQLYLKAMTYFDITLYPPANMGIEGSFRHQSPCWFCVECEMCGQRCFVKKDDSQETYPHFMMKLCMSIWMTHVLGYQVDIENEWHSRNQSWNICNKREDDYFHVLKEAEDLDLYHFVEKNNETGYLNFQHCLHIFLDMFLKQYNTIIESLTAYMIDIRIQSHQTNKSNNVNLQQNDSPQQKESANDKNQGSNDNPKSAVVGKKKDITDNEDDIPISQLRKKKRKSQSSRNDKSKSKSSTKTKRKRQHLVEARFLQKNNTLPQIQCNTTTDLDRMEEEKEYDKIVQKDYEIQRKADSIEYIHVKTCKHLYSNSKAYIKELKKMSKKEKIEMSEIEDYDSDTDRKTINDENHFILHTTDGLAVVIHENWFEIEQEEWNNTDHRRIDEKTEQKCLKSPNKKFKLSTKEKQKIRNACKVITEHSQIHRIKRLEFDRKNYLYYETNFKNKLLRTSVKYIGIDMLNNTIPLEDHWIKLNFERHTEFWNEIQNMEANDIIEVPTGSSNNDIENFNIPDEDKGPLIAYHQTVRDQCLIFSLASIFNHLNLNYISDHLIKFNNNCLTNRTLCKMGDVLDVMSNKHRSKGEKKIKLKICKVKFLENKNVLKDKYNNKVFHCILENHHAVVLYKQHIFDPIFKYALPRNPHYLKICAEMEENAIIDNAIFKAVCYEI